MRKSIAIAINFARSSRTYVADVLIECVDAFSGSWVAAIFSTLQSIVAVLGLVDASENRIARFSGASVVVVTVKRLVNASFNRVTDILGAFVVVIATNISGHASWEISSACLQFSIQAFLVLSTFNVCSLFAVVGFPFGDAGFECIFVAWSVELIVAFQSGFSLADRFANSGLLFNALFFLRSAFLRADNL